VSAEKALTTILLTTLLFSTIPFTTAQEEEFEWNRPIPFIGAQPTLVLMVQFTDVKMSISRAQAEQIVKVVDNFIRTASYGRTWIDYTIHPRVLTLPKPMAYYGGPSPGAQRGDDSDRIIEYHLTTIRLAKQEGIDLSKYKHIIIIHAGKDEAAGGTANDIWSHCHCVAPKILYFWIEKNGFDVVEADLRKNPRTQWVVELFMHRTRDGRGHLIAGIETVAEYDIPAVMAHEFTHSMWIPDHYVYGKDGYSGGSEVGVWTNMDYGPFLDPPVDIDGWSKYRLGWVEAVTVERDGEYTIHTLDKPDEPHGLIIPINDREYYFIHARRPVGQDAALPGPGVLVFRVNKYKQRNVEGEPFMVQLYDAHPNTPPECERFAGNKDLWTLCVKLDAPYYDRTGYRNMWGRFTISLQNPELVTEEGFRITVTSFDQGSGVAKVRISLRGDSGGGGGDGGGGDGGGGGGGTTTVTITRTVTGTATETLYTTTTVVGAETRTVVVTVTTTLPPPDTGEQYISLAIILAALIIALSMVASVRRRAPPPPPPMWS
jgi:M6 family metalloprotease-like protein